MRKCNLDYNNFILNLNKNIFSPTLAKTTSDCIFRYKIKYFVSKFSQDKFFFFVQHSCVASVVQFLAAVALVCLCVALPPLLLLGCGWLRLSDSLFVCFMSILESALVTPLDSFPCPYLLSHPLHHSTTPKGPTAACRYGEASGCANCWHLQLLGCRALDLAGILRHGFYVSLCCS